MLFFSFFKTLIITEANSIHAESSNNAEQRPRKIKIPIGMAFDDKILHHSMVNQFLID